MTPTNPPMFRFTIRDVLWLTVVVALAVRWWVDHEHLTFRCRISPHQEDFERRRFEGMVFFVDDLMKGFEAVHPGCARSPILSIGWNWKESEN